MDMIQDLLKQIRKNPNRPDLHNTIGTVYQQQGNMTEAANHFLTAARMFASEDSVTRNLNKAIAILKRMLRDFPDMQDPYFILADLHEEMDNREEAVEVYNQLADLYVGQEKYLMAVSVYDKVISMVPDSFEAWQKFAELNRDAGMPFHASQAFTRAASLCGEGDADARLDLVLQSLRLDPEGAETLEVLKNHFAGREVSQEDADTLLSAAEELLLADWPESVVKVLGLIPEKARTAMVNEVLEKASALVVTDDQADKDAGTGRAADLAGTKVLVVDDEKEILLLLEQILRQEGFTVISAQDGEEALKLFMEERPPLVVSDAMLPKLHGFELCSRIKEITDHTVKVMILTAVYKKYKYKGKVQEEYHVDEYLDKPFQITEFLDTFYRMAESMADKITIREEEPQDESDILIMVAGSGEKELRNKLEGFCEKTGCSYQISENPREMFEVLQDKVPDIMLVTESLPGMDPFLAAYMLRDMLDLGATTFVLVTRDPALLDGKPGDFHHRVAAPVGPGTLKAIIKLHRDNRARLGLGKVDTARTLSDRRIEAVIRSKVERVLKSHNHLEEYYSSRIRELEKELDELKPGDGEDD
jgi:DNA-binding response OmpR family regulator